MKISAAGGFPPIMTNILAARDGEWGGGSSFCKTGILVKIVREEKFIAPEAGIDCQRFNYTKNINYLDYDVDYLNNN